METISLVILIVAAIVSVMLIVAIFTIKDNVIKHTEILENQSVMIEYQNEVMGAQLELIASIADKAGVPIKDINDVTEKYGITFENITGV